MKNFFKKLFCSDSMSKNFSETVQRIGKNNAGFSLVELIVVIAIMAILATVAVIGVSVYIPKAQKAADEQMIADIQTAINLYTAGETLTAGQSGYVVVHKAGGVSVGGDMGTVLTEALVATFGEGYTSELKVAYPKWSGTWSAEDLAAIQNSVYMQNVYGKDDGMLETVQMLTDAMKGFYDINGVGNSQQAANMAVLDVAASTKNYVNKDAFVAWWTDGSNGLNSLSAAVPSSAFNFPDSMNGTMEPTKIKLAAQYARGKAFVMSTDCADCMAAFGTSDNSYFDNIKTPDEALGALDKIIIATGTHINGCSTCLSKVDEYFSATGSAKSDAEAYIALLGQIDSMSDTITESPEFQGDDLYTSGFVKDFVNEYVSEVQAYQKANAQLGDIVVTVVVDQNGDLRFKGNLTE